MQKYSIFNLVKNAFSGHENWDLAWKDPTPKKEYDVVIIGGGGHGLATAYYLAKEHNITNVAIIEKGWIGGGNVGRNTTIIRSNYMHDDNALFSEFGMDLWRKMSQDLNYNVMFSPRGIINLAHSDAQMNVYARRGNSMRLNGIDAVLLNREQVKEIIPMADFSENVRFPIFGGLMQPSAGTARHDAVAWGYARQADSMGVDIIQNCEVTGFDVSGGKINGVRTSRGDIKVKKIGLCVAGSTNVLAEKLNMTLPIETHLLQACVSEPVKPILDRVVTFGAGKFLDIKCRKSNLKPSCVVIVATIRALKMHGGVAKDDLKNENVDALKKGLVNLERHIQNVQKFGLPVAVAVNHFIKDTDSEVKALIEFCDGMGVKASLISLIGKECPLGAPLRLGSVEKLY